MSDQEDVPSFLHVMKLLDDFDQASNTRSVAWGRGAGPDFQSLQDKVNQTKAALKAEILRLHVGALAHHMANK